MKATSPVFRLFLGLFAFALGWELLTYWGASTAQSPTLPLGEPRPFSGAGEWEPLLAQNPKTALEIPPEKQEQSACYRAYRKFYEHSILDLRIAFGYKDARPARYVGDRYEKIALLSSLLGSCHGTSQACGFRRAEDDADLFTKEIIGPDHLPRTIELRITHSSVGPDDDENRNDSFQAWQSSQSKTNFLEGIQRADAVFYNGHSRDGGGPDFDLPHLTPDKHVDYDWYSENRPGLESLVEALENSMPVKLLGLFSCLSTEHFLEEIRASHEDLAMITSPRLLYYTDALNNMLGTISALLGLWCEPSFDLVLRSEVSGEFSHLRGFF